MECAQILGINARRVVDASAGDVEESCLADDAQVRVRFFNERYFLFVREALVIFFSTSQSLLDVRQ